MDLRTMGVLRDLVDDATHVSLKKLKGKDKVHEFAGCDGNYFASVRECPRR
jgi:hypothetical protein